MGAVRITDDRLNAGLLILGVFIGSALWWLCLSALAGAVRHKFSPNWLLWLNRGSGVVLGVFGLVVLGSLFFAPDQMPAFPTPHTFGARMSF